MGEQCRQLTRHLSSPITEIDPIRLDLVANQSFDHDRDTSGSREAQRASTMLAIHISGPIFRQHNRFVEEIYQTSPVSRW